MAEVVARDGIDGPSDFSRGDFITIVHEFAVAVATDDDPGAAGKIGESDFQLVVAVHACIDIGEGGNEGVVNSVEGGMHP